jgi:hypothetical protein
MAFINSVEKSINKVEYTNLYLYEILITDYLDNHENYNGLTEREISERWRNNERYIKSFYPSYIQRKIGPNGILSLDLDRYKIKETDAGFQDLLNRQLIESVTSTIDAPNPIIETINFFTNTNDSKTFFEKIIQLLKEGTPNDFEVLTFAILREYLKIYGYELQRFTPTNANDGGVDFIGGNVIYCITTQLNKKKLIADIEKTNAPKIFIYRDIKGRLEDEINKYIYDGKISDTLNIELIINRHINFLKDKPESFRIVERLKTVIINQYQMEIV